MFGRGEVQTSRAARRFVQSATLGKLVNSTSAIDWLAAVFSSLLRKLRNSILNLTPSAALPAAQNLLDIFSYLASTLIVLPWIFNLSVIALLNLQAFDEFLISKYCHLLSENRKILLLLSSRFIVWACTFANSFYIQQIIGMHRRKRCEASAHAMFAFKAISAWNFAIIVMGAGRLLLTGVIFVMNDRRFCIVGAAIHGQIIPKS